MTVKPNELVWHQVAPAPEPAALSTGQIWRLKRVLHLASFCGVTYAETAEREGKLLVFLDGWQRPITPGVAVDVITKRIARHGAPPHDSSKAPQWTCLLDAMASLAEIWPWWGVLP